jgi:endonuclease/exonuclease/phosphatase (EEP) superfamily protein YafD
VILSGRAWFWNLLDIAPPIAFAVLPLPLLGAAYLTRRWLVGAFAVCALLVGAPSTGLNPATLLPAEAGHGPGIRIVSWDTFFWDQGADPAVFYDYLRSRNADVYLLQEHLFNDNGRPTPIDDLARLHAAFPGYQVATAGEFVTVSRYPIVARRPLIATGLPAPDSAWADYWNIRVLRTDLRIGDRVVTAYNTHMPDPFKMDDSPLTARFYRDTAEMADRQRAQFAALAADLRDNTNPVVLSGDLNLLPGNTSLAWFAPLEDAAQTAGGPLYAASFPAGPAALWRLDWSMTSSEVVVRGYHLEDPPAGLSTHRLQDLNVSIS